MQEISQQIKAFTRCIITANLFTDDMSASVLDATAIKMIKAFLFFNETNSTLKFNSCVGYTSSNDVA